MEKRSKATAQALADIKTVLEISELAAKIGWVVAIPDTNSFDHIILGTKEAVTNVASNSVEEYTLMEKGQLN
jgi:hypothetical protein